jgi:hypothetical protein
MPGGLSWQQYIVFSISAITTMFIGASIVHNIYKPNLVCYCYVKLLTCVYIINRQFLVLVTVYLQRNMKINKLQTRSMDHNETNIIIVIINIDYQSVIVAFSY